MVEGKFQYEKKITQIKSNTQILMSLSVLADVWQAVWCRSPYREYTKVPLSEKNRDMTKEFLKAAEYSILNMKLSDGRFVLHTARCEYEYYFYSILTLFTIRWSQLRG